MRRNMRGLRNSSTISSAGRGGVQLCGWSYRQDRYREFEPDRSITRKTYIYAYYDNNEKEVDDTRRELEEAIREAIGISDDHS